MISHGDWVTAVWATGIPLLAIFTVLALYLGGKLRSEEESVDTFITGRQRTGAWRLTWAFVTGVLGSWVVTRPGYLAASTGVFGLCTYSVSIGLSVLIMACIGAVICQKTDDSATSIGDFFRWRFGPLGQIYIVVLVVFNMSVLLLAEYTNMISIFQDYVDTGYFAILTAIGILCLIYTTVGGVFTSIIINQFQAMASIILTVAVAAYLGVTFDRDLPTELTTKQAGLNPTGWSTVVIFPLTILATTLFTESNWQRCWSASSPRSLIISSSMASLLLIVLTFMFGILALLGQWTSPTPSADTAAVPVIGVATSYHPYYSFFSVLDKKPSATSNITLSSWGGVVTVLLSIVFSQSHVAALQSGITATLSSYFLEGHSPLFVVRTISMLVNIPILSIALRSIGISELYQLANMLCAMTMCPAFLGVVPGLFRWYSGDMMFYSVTIGFVGATGFGISEKWETGNDKLVALKRGLALMWWNQEYSYKRVLAVVFCSIIGIIITMVLGLPFTACKLRIGSLSGLIFRIQQRFLNIWHQPMKHDRMEEDIEQKEVLNVEPPSVSKTYADQAKITAMSVFGGVRDASPVRDQMGPAHLGARRYTPHESSMPPHRTPSQPQRVPSQPQRAPSQPHPHPQTNPSNWQRVVPYEPRK